MMRTMLVAILVFGWVPLGATQDVPYRTSFEEPTYTLGTLDGQDGWRELSASGSGVVQNAFATGIGRGAQSLQVAAESSVARDIASNTGETVYVDGYYRGPTVTATPTLTEPGSSIILFHSDAILALDGDGSGGGTWMSTGVAVSEDTLQRITIRQDYGSQSWDLYIDGTSVLTGLGFKNNLARLSGIDIETSDGGSGFLDDFSVTNVPPDFLADPALFYFQTEWNGAGNLEWDLAPLAPDGDVSAADLLELLDRLGN